jgi:putative phage-type endonuclease
MNVRDEWLRERQTGIGGSDVAAILGLSKYKTPYTVYQEKRGELGPQPDNEAMRWGRYLEPAVRQAYADETGRQVLLPEKMIRHPRHGFMVANLDGYTEDRRIFEAKTARSADGWGMAGSDEIPQPYLLQVQHYLEVTGFEVADVAVLIAGSDFRLYEVPADRELQEMLVDAEADFWKQVHVIARWGRVARTDCVMADDDTFKALCRLAALQGESRELERQLEAAKATVMKAMGECDTLVDPHGHTLATWKLSRAPQRFDAAAFKAAQPALHAQFIREGEPSRRFLLKATA